MTTFTIIIGVLYLAIGITLGVIMARFSKDGPLDRYGRQSDFSRIASSLAMGLSWGAILLFAIFASAFSYAYSRWKGDW